MLIAYAIDFLTRKHKLYTRVGSTTKHMKIKKFASAVTILGLIALSGAPVAQAVQTVDPINRTPSSPSTANTGSEENDCGAHNPNIHGVETGIACRPTTSTGSSTTGSATGSSTSETTPTLTTPSHPTMPPKKLQDASLMLCEKRQTNINNILTRIVTRGTNQMNLFLSIATKVEAFKTNEDLTVTNYDALAAAISTDQAKITADLATMKTSDTISCTANDPKGMISNFQTELKTDIIDLLQLKTDVKNLIVAVKAALPNPDKSNTSNSQAGSGGSN